LTLSVLESLARLPVSARKKFCSVHIDMVNHFLGHSPWTHSQRTL
jgi:hypothetical protein